MSGRKLFLTLFIIISITSQLFALPLKNSDKKYLYAEIGNKHYSLEVADTFIKKFTGLSNREKMAKDQGMIFMLGWLGKHDFCMRKMKFPLDFIWLKGNKVVDLRANVPIPKSKKLKAIISRVKSNQVIELNAGEIKHSKIKLGDIVRFYSKK